MGLFDFIIRLLGGQPTDRTRGNGAAPRSTATAATSTPTKRTLNLDASQFAPISRTDTLKRARRASSFWGGGWFGRTDAIPPTSDERTLLIDRTLVVYGLVTPE